MLMSGYLTEGGLFADTACLAAAHVTNLPNLPVFK
jgi:hypothetical protein